MRWFVVAFAVFALSASLAIAGPPLSPTNPGAPSGNTPLLSPAPPTSLAGNASYVSACVPASAYRAFDAHAETAAAATLQVQRYHDLACAHPLVPALPATPLALTTGAPCPGSTRCGDVGSNDGVPFIALVVTLTDTSGSTNTVSAMTLTQGAE